MESSQLKVLKTRLALSREESQETLLKKVPLSFSEFIPESFFKKFLFIYFWLHWVFVAARGPSLVESSGGYSLLRCAGLSPQWPLLLRSTGTRRVGFSSCGSRAQ